MTDKKTDNVLADAVVRNSAMILSLPSAGMLRHHKSRFLSMEDGKIWVEGAPSDRALVEELIASGTRAGVSFKTGTRMINFSTTVLRRMPDYRMNGDVTLEAILLAQPPEIESIQRRNSYRVCVPDSCDIVARAWRLTEHAVLRDRPLASTELLIKLVDISAGGIGVILSAKNEDGIKISRDERLRVEISYEGALVLVEGRMRLPAKFDPYVKTRAGIAFKKLESNLEGRQSLAMLTKIVGDLQRDEVRRKRREAG